MQSSEVHQPPAGPKMQWRSITSSLCSKSGLLPTSDRSDFSALIPVFASFATAYTNFHFSYIKFFNLLWFQKSFMNPVLKARSNSRTPDSYTRWWIELRKSNISENMTAFVNISRLMTNSETLVASLSKSDQAAHSLFSGYWQTMDFYQNHNFCGMCFKKGKIQLGHIWNDAMFRKF